jgi:hypothetical protein
VYLDLDKIRRDSSRSFPLDINIGSIPPTREGWISEFARTQRLRVSLRLERRKIILGRNKKSTSRIDSVNPKLKCHPIAQSRNVTFLLGQETEFAAGSRESFSAVVKARRFCIVTPTTLFAVLDEQKKQMRFYNELENGYGSLDWNWRKTKHGSSRSVVIARERRASSFWVSSFAGV